MANVATFSLAGDKELIAALRELEPKLSSRVLSKAMRQAAQPILKSAKSNAPVKSGETKRRLKVRAMKRKKGRVGVTVQTGEGPYKGDTYYASFYEWGTSHQPARPFMRPAFDTNKAAALSILTDEISAGLQAVAAGLTKLRRADVKQFLG